MCTSMVQSTYEPVEWRTRIFRRRETMIVVMQVDSTEEDIELIQNHLTSKGLEGQVNRGVERTVIGVMGQIFPELLNELEVLPGVREVVPVSRPYKLSSREFQPNPTTIQVGPVTIGGEDMVIMAGPSQIHKRQDLIIQ